MTRILGAMLCAMVLMAGCAKPLEVKQATGFVAGAASLKVAVLPVQFGSAKQKNVARVFREQIYANLQDSDYRLVELVEVDQALYDMGLHDAADVQRALREDAQALAQALGADAAIATRITEWSLTYLAVHSDVELEAESRLIDLDTGREWMRVSKGVIQSAGLSKVPTGFVSAGIAPLKGLMKSVQQQVVDQLSWEMATVLSGKKIEEDV